jgi:hypothetical protein
MGNMGKHGKTWENMGKHGKTWENMGKHGKTWENMGKRGKHGNMTRHSQGKLAGSVAVEGHS